MKIDRRDFLKLAGLGSAVFLLGPAHFVLAGDDKMSRDDFFFVQMSDTHWGFSNPKANPDFAGTLKKAVAAVNSLQQQPDFIMFTGDLTHITDDPEERRKRLAGFKDIVKDLKNKHVRFMPGEHDAGVDKAEAYKEFFGEQTHYTFDHKGVHFIVLDNVSDPRSIIGDAQLSWLSDDLKKLDKNSRIVVFTHRPLFNLYEDWEWYTRDGSKAIELLQSYPNVIVFYGHIHQEHHLKTGHIWHHASKGLMYELPYPGSVPVKMPVPWNKNAPYEGLGFREVGPKTKQARYDVTEFDVMGEKL